ncbi:hypothetical protein BGZ80_001760 [Entomortierella chlamydospora]|uniref:C3H1-type domain-containing protein n=1 Tax=Entomortierella chlamydospora TaxID=101097 RepID=A0A9P6MRE4_9FUNG|nr:hypothetical protein BGZ80_001760 [Entomortierella chlamydospora]
MPKIEIGTPQEKELTALVLAKLNDYGWADNEVLANFIVVMIANEKSRSDIISELNDILPGQAPEFVDWLSESLDSISNQGQAANQMDQLSILHPDPQQNYDQDVDVSSTQIVNEQELIDTESSPSNRQRSNNNPSDARAPGRLLQSAISGATRSDNSPATSHRQAPSRVYEAERPTARHTPREKSTSPVRSREQGLSTSRIREEHIRFRRTSRERAADENRMDSRLGNGRGGGDKDRLRGRLGGRLDDRLGKKGDNRSVRSRERSWDTSSDYHDRRNGKNQRNGRNRSGDRVDLEALRNIERRLGTRPSDQRSNGDDDGKSWSRTPDRPRQSDFGAQQQSATPGGDVTRCRFWPNCSQGEACQYWHPRELCADFPNCSKTSDTCLYIHPLAEPTAEQVAAAARQVLMQSMRNNTNNKNVNGSGEGEAKTPVLNALQMPFALGSQPSAQDCKFGARCTRPDCKFRHPQKEANPQQQQCRFFPHCTKPNCPFFHPPYGEQLADSAMDETGAPVSTSAPGVSMNGEGLVNRLPTPCRFGDQCTRPGCHFTHPRDGGAAASTMMPLCKFNPCTRPGCPFRHVPGMTPNKSLILNGAQKQSRSERFAGGVVDDSEVEKLHVPASSHWASGGVSRQPGQQLQTVDESAVQATDAQTITEMDMDMEIAI